MSERCKMFQSKSIITDIPNRPERYIQKISCPPVKMCLKWACSSDILLIPLHMQHCMSLLMCQCGGRKCNWRVSLLPSNVFWIRVFSKEKWADENNLSNLIWSYSIFKRCSRNLFLFSCKYVEIVSGYKLAVYKGDQPKDGRNVWFVISFSGTEMPVIGIYHG